MNWAKPQLSNVAEYQDAILLGEKLANVYIITIR